MKQAQQAAEKKGLDVPDRTARVPDSPGHTDDQTTVWDSVGRFIFTGFTSASGKTAEYLGFVCRPAGGTKFQVLYSDGLHVTDFAAEPRPRWAPRELRQAENVAKAAAKARAEKAAAKAAAKARATEAAKETEGVTDTGNVPIFVKDLHVYQLKKYYPLPPLATRLPPVSAPPKALPHDYTDARNLKPLPSGFDVPTWTTSKAQRRSKSDRTAKKTYTAYPSYQLDDSNTHLWKKFQRTQIECFPLNLSAFRAPGAKPIFTRID